MLSSDDSGNYRTGTFFYQGQTGSQGMIFTPYGLIHNPPDNSMAILFSQNGQDSNSIAIVDDPINRIKNLAKGEVGIANYGTGTNVICKANGDVDVTGTNDVNITLPAANSVNITIDTMTAVIDASGITITNGDVVADGISLKTHTHPIVGGSSAPGPTGAPT